jgi:hypothetical protein
LKVKKPYGTITWQGLCHGKGANKEGFCKSPATQSGKKGILFSFLTTIFRNMKAVWVVENFNKNASFPFAGKPALRGVLEGRIT